MTRVFLGLGSNALDAPVQIAHALSLLKLRFDLVVSSAVCSEAKGFAGNPFVNCVARFDTNLELSDLLAFSKRVEIQLGKDLTQPRFSDKRIDLDVLYFGDTVRVNDRFAVPARDVLESYYLFGLRELQPDWIDPSRLKTISDLCNEQNLADLPAVELPHVDEQRTSKIRIDDFRLSLHLGVTEEERANQQEVSLNLTLELTNVPHATYTDSVEETINYSTLARAITSEIGGTTVQTIEHLAERCTRTILKTVAFEGRLSVEVRKNPSTPGIVGGAYFELTSEVF